MSADELRFRVVSETRKAADRARARVAPFSWERADLVRLLAPDAGADVARACDLLRVEDWCHAHRQLAHHFTRRLHRFPVAPLTLDELSGRVNRDFPEAAADARNRADNMLAGRYDVLGYRQLQFETPPRWQFDPVHRRTAPTTFWSEVPYLDPSSGDHKIIWELNRHQHWLGLGRAYHLTGDARYYRAVVDQLQNWMAMNPPLLGINWASMLEVGFRSLSWLWALHFFTAVAATDDEGGAPWIVDLLLGLHRQMTHVARNLSLYFSPNTHLTGEALALYVAGRALPELRDSRRWAALGRAVLVEEANRQINKDGGHVELSAHYHRYTTDFYLLALRIARITGDPVADTFEQAARKAANYLRTLTDDEGRLPLIGDDDGGQLFPICYRPAYDCRDTLAAAAAILDTPDLGLGSTPEEVYWFCGDLIRRSPHKPSLRPSTALSDSGYYVSRNALGDHLVFDAGPHGFLNGGHAHADALSIVLTVRGRPLIVDPGTATYTMDAGLRDRFRSTAMHNTVVVNDRPQSEPRGPFHWRNVATARATFWMSEPRFDYAEGRHDGYRPIVHLRGVLAIHGLGWMVLDHLLGDGEATAENFWHIHPAWNVSQVRGDIILQSADRSIGLTCSAGLGVIDDNQTAELGVYAPLYGCIERAPLLRSRTSGRIPRSWLTCLIPHPADQPMATGVTIEALPLEIAAPHPWISSGFRLTAGARRFAVLACASADDTILSAGPSQLWGCAGARTDGRFAVIDLETAAPLALVGGTHASVASSVHE